MTRLTNYQQDSFLLLPDGERWRVTSPLVMESETEMVRTAMANRPDVRWKHTDSHGHVHQYVRDEEQVPRLPSLEPRSRLVECDGDCGDGGCDGYTITEWFCRECGEQVEPKFIHDYEAESVGIPVQRTINYTVTVEVPSRPAEPLVGAEYGYTDTSGAEHRYALPPLHPGNTRAWSSPDGFVMHAEFHGTEYKSVEWKPTGP